MRISLFYFILFANLLITQNIFATDKNSHNVSKLAFNVGQIGIADSIQQQNLYGFEYQANSFDVYSYPIIPVLGLVYSESGNKFVNVNFRYDHWLNDNWVLTPLWGFGYFEDSDEIELGLELEFVSGLEIAYQFNNNNRIGLVVTHLSNAGFSSINPGTETASLSFSIPLNGL